MSATLPIQVRTLSGTVETHMIDLNETVGAFKQRYATAIGVDAEHIMFVFAGRPLDDGQTFTEQSGVQRDSTIHHVMSRLRPTSDDATEGNQ